MKKILSIAIVAAMLLSTLLTLTAIPAAAVDGEWIVYGTAAEYYDDFDLAQDDIVPVPGYSYIPGEGLVVTPADWKDFNPEIGLSTRNKVNLKDGVYLLVRVDDFTFSGDKWFTYSISDVQYLDVGSTEPKFGERVSMLTRPGDNGKLATNEWRSRNFQQDSLNMTFTCDEEKYYDEDGKILLELVVTWDGSSYNASFNGTPAPEATIAWMNQKYGSDDSAYINLNVHNGTVGGTAAITVLKYGKSEATATVPQGDDYAEKRDSYKTIAEIANPSTVPEGQPAILMNGSREQSDSKGTVRNTGITSLTPENFIHYKADRAIIEIGFTAKYEKSYDIDDFPVIAVLTKNLCACGGESVEDCYAIEHADMYIMTGEHTIADGEHMLTNIDICSEALVSGGDSYLYFYVDTSEEGLLNWDPEGRFNGARFDIYGINTSVPGMNEFDVCFMGLFRTVEEAEAYILDFVGPLDEKDPEEESESETDDVLDPDGPQNPDDDLDESESKDDGNGDGNGNSDTASGGCFSSAGFGLIAMISLACGAGFVAFKKRR